MQRRQFITLLGGAAAWPVASDAQQPALPIIGFLHARSPADAGPQVAAFRRGLADTGYVDGRNAIIEYRWALGEYDRLPSLAAETVRLPAIVIVAGTEPAVLAARAATSTIPIVFSIGGDPVKLGLVASYNLPGGNATGISMFTSALEGKRLGLLHELVPNASVMGVLLNPKYSLFETQLRDVREAARTLNLELHELSASNDQDIDAAFDQVKQLRIAALLQAADPFFDTRREKLVAFAARYAVPTMYHFREFIAVGGLMTYGIDILDVYRQVGVYTGRILKGEKPTDLPVVQPTKFELVINLATAKALGLSVPDKLLALADEVIE